MLGIGAYKQRMVAQAEALPGRDARMSVPQLHHALHVPLQTEAAPERSLTVGMGCFWGVERLFWQQPGVQNTAAGYAGGFTPNPTYEEVCTGLTGHAEVVRLQFDPTEVALETLLQLFWERHDPTEGMRQGDDIGTQYRSVIHCHTQAQYEAALASRDAYQHALSVAGLGQITTEIVYPAPTFYFAEPEHQQYLSKIPHGYCGLRGTGVSCAA